MSVGPTTAEDLRQALTTALTGATADELDRVLRATTVLTATDVNTALLHAARAAEQIATRRADETNDMEALIEALMDAAEAAAEDRGHAFADDTLDEDVHAAASNAGSAVNNGGAAAQVLYLAEQLGSEHVRALLASQGVGATPTDARVDTVASDAQDR